MEKFVCIFGTESAVLFVPQNWWKDLHCCDYHEIHLQLVVSPLLKLEEDANAGGNEHLVLDPMHLCQLYLLLFYHHLENVFITHKTISC